MCVKIWNNLSFCYALGYNILVFCILGCDYHPLLAGIVHQESSGWRGSSGTEATRHYGIASGAVFPWTTTEITQHASGAIST